MNKKISNDSKRCRKQAANRRLLLESLENRHLMAADVIVQWNNAALDAIRNEPSVWNPGGASRTLAIVHAAAFDAVNAITKSHTNFALTEEAPIWSSKEAAAATAARDALVNLFPSQAGKFHTLWQQSLYTIPDGAAEDAGVAIGHAAATAVLNLRKSDGSDSPSFYEINPGVGHWDVDPLHPNQVAWGPNWGSVTPFGMRYTADFDVPPPPALNSQAYADAYNEVKSLGARNSSTRTADQTEIGIFWGYDIGTLGTPVALYNQSAQTIAELKGNSLEENARMFALVNVAMADAGMATWKAKYEYDLWRPITGIRDGNIDGNPQTVGDVNWVPLGSPGPDPNSTSDDFTPPFPAYTSGHAAFGAATFRTLAHFYGSDQFNFTLRSDELPGVTRSYTSFSQAADENSVSRVYLGVHWRFDSTEGQVLGSAVADDLFQQMLVPRQSATVVEVQRVGGGFRAVTIPEGTGVVLDVTSNLLTFTRVDTGEVIFQEKANEVASIRVDGRNQSTDFLDIRVANGASIPQSIVFEVVGDQGWFDGVGLTTGSGNDNLWLANNQLSAEGTTPVIYLYGLGFVDVNAGGGNDQLKVTGVQQWRQVNFDGGHGDDRYYIWSQSAHMYVSDPSGNDTLDYSWVSSSLFIELDKSNGEYQYTGANMLRLWGDIEGLMGSNHNDRLYGNHLANTINGQSGDDVIFGRAGDDTLIGNWGNDLVYGGDGNDQIWTGHGNDIALGGNGNDSLYGGDGMDLLIGGYGLDYVMGESGDDLLIGGFTSFDGNEGALWAILAEWTSSRTRTQRQQNLLGTGFGTRLNQSYFLRSGSGGTIHNDQATDVLVKGAGDAWTLTYPLDQVRNS